jgi:hypothetical protein
MPRKTRQQKKALSYTKDRRNCYGENSKASRKNIPKARAHTHRAFRKKVRQALREELGAVSPEQLEEQETAATSVRRKQWKKVPDIPLAQHIIGQVRRRKSRENKKVLQDRASKATVQRGAVAKSPDGGQLR